MHFDTIITRTDYENYLIYLYFGEDSDLIGACMQRAYRDFNRTLHGFGRLKNKKEIYKKAESILRDCLENLKSSISDECSDKAFDNWHQETCNSLISVFAKNGHYLYVGQAQKWINMTLKYIFTVGEKRITGFTSVYPHCHIPLDNILLEKLATYDFPRLSSAWSRLDSYAEYLEKQKWVRQRFSLIPMDLEFQLWMNQSIE